MIIWLRPRWIGSRVRVCRFARRIVPGRPAWRRGRRFLRVCTRIRQAFYSFDHWANHRNWVQDLSDAGYYCVNIGKMHMTTPRDIPGGFHERVIVENPTNKALDGGGADGRLGQVHDVSQCEAAQ